MLRIGTLKPHPATDHQKLVATGEADVSAQQRRPQYRTSEPQFRMSSLPLQNRSAPYRVKLIYCELGDYELTIAIESRLNKHIRAYFRLSTKYNSVSVFQYEYTYDLPSGVIWTDAG